MNEIVDWGAVLLGFSVGTPISLLFFVGLAQGVQLALRARRPEAWLLLSAGCRISLLLAVGFWVTAFGAGTWSLAGYALAFFLVRLAAVLWANTFRAATLPGQEVA